MLVRQKGQFIKVNAQALPQRDALNLGRVRVGNTPAASFKIRRSGREASGTFKTPGFASDFIKGSKSLGEDVYVERPSRRIKSIGEKLGITRLGIQTRRKR